MCFIFIILQKIHGINLDFVGFSFVWELVAVFYLLRDQGDRFDDDQGNDQFLNNFINVT